MGGHGKIQIKQMCALSALIILTPKSGLRVQFL